MSNPGPTTEIVREPNDGPEHPVRVFYELSHSNRSGRTGQIDFEVWIPCQIQLIETGEIIGDGEGSAWPSKTLGTTLHGKISAKTWTA